MTSSIVAVFDFDHTLTDRDSMLFFLFYLQGRLKTYYHLTNLLPAFGSFLAGCLSRQKIKEKILTHFFREWPFEDLQAWGQQYANQQLDDYLKPPAMQRLVWHQTQGHRCILVSASCEFYLQPWALRHGFEAVFASLLELAPTGHITGKLRGLNCWGPEKLRRLMEYLGTKENYQLYVYGDSRGDRELLEYAHYPFYRKFG